MYFWNFNFVYSSTFFSSRPYLFLSRYLFSTHFISSNNAEWKNCGAQSNREVSPHKPATTLILYSPQEYSYWVFMNVHVCTLIRASSRLFCELKPTRATEFDAFSCPEMHRCRFFKSKINSTKWHQKTIKILFLQSFLKKYQIRFFIFFK